MKNYIFLAFLLYFIIPKILLAQTTMVGIGLEPSIMSIDNLARGSNKEMSTSINGIIIITPIRQIEIEGKSGFALSENYSGGELSAYFRVFPLQYDIFLVVGHKWHWNMSVEAGNRAGVDGGLFKMPGIGIGYKFNNLYLEGFYYKTNPKKLEWGLLPINQGYTKVYNNINEIFSISISYFWTL